jgi:hypothetical protein
MVPRTNRLWAERTAVLSLAFLCLSPVLTSPAWANALPECLILTHVEAAGDPCRHNTITACEDIVQFTDLDGSLEFCLFIYPSYWLGDSLWISRFEAPVSWPEGWQLLQWHACGGGWGDFDVAGSGGDLEVVWPEPALIAEEVFLAACFRIYVDGFGRFECPGSSDIWLCRPPDEWNTYGMGIDARAADACSDCRVRCTGSAYCRPRLSPEEVTLDVGMDWVVETAVRISAHTLSGELCDLTVDTDVPWISIETTPINWDTIEASLTIDSSDLELGTHRAFLRATGGCMACGRLVLNVRQDPPSPDVTSWGRVKVLFR